MPNMIDEMWKILTTLTDEAQNNARQKCHELAFDPNRGTVSLDESFINLSADRTILTDAIEKKKLIQLPITIQKQLLSYFEAISKSLTNLTNGTDEVANLTNYIEQLHMAIWQYGLHNLSEEILGYQTKMNQLKNQELELKKLRAEIDGGLKLKGELNKLLEKTKKATETMQTVLSTAEENAKKVAANLNQTSETSEKTAAVFSTIQQTKKSSEEIAAAVSTTKDKVDAWAKEVKKVADTATAVCKNSDELEKRLDDLVGKTGDVYKRVEDLLPGAASAGLASAYKQRKENIARSKGRWIAGFVLTLMGLAGMAIWIVIQFQNQKEGSMEWWLFLLQRAPLTFPFIWLGWFFSRNYGHAVRLEEVYAFKEAISQSFEGYKNQMKEVTPDKGLPNLCENVISILSESPLTVFDRKTTDETPANSILERIMPKRKQSQVE